MKKQIKTARFPKSKLFLKLPEVVTSDVDETNRTDLVINLNTKQKAKLLLLPTACLEDSDIRAINPLTDANEYLYWGEVTFWLDVAMLEAILNGKS